MLAVAALSPTSYAPVVAPRAATPKMSFSDEVSFASKPWTSSEISDAAGLEVQPPLLQKNRPGGCIARAHCSLC